MDIATRAYVDQERWAAMEREYPQSRAPEKSEAFWRRLVDEDNTFLFKAAGNAKRISAHLKEASRFARRHPIPEFLQARVWFRITGGEEYSAKMPERHMLDIIERYYGSPIPEDLKRPSFKSTFDSNRFCLNRDGIRSLVHVTTAIALLHPEMTYSPMLPFLCAIFLHFMTDAAAFATCCAIIEHHRYLVSSRSESWRMLMSFTDLVSSVLPNVASSSSSSPELKEFASSHVFSGFCFKWFVEDLPLQSSIFMMDNLATEGIKALYRIGLAIVRTWSAGDHSQSISVIAKSFHDPSVVNLAYKHSFSRKQIASSHERHQHHSERVVHSNGAVIGVGEDDLSQEPHLPQPPLASKSAVLGTQQWEQLWRRIPKKLHHSRIVCAFETARDGCSLRILYARAGHLTPSLLLVRSMDGVSFGALLATAWSERLSGQFFGSADSFVFSFAPEFRSYTAIQSLVQFGDDTVLCVGGKIRGHAIRLTNDLHHGVSEQSEAFQSQPLTLHENFQADHVELWHFT